MESCKIWNGTLSESIFRSDQKVPGQQEPPVPVFLKEDDTDEPD